MKLPVVSCIYCKYYKEYVNGDLYCKCYKASIKDIITKCTFYEEKLELEN